MNSNWSYSPETLNVEPNGRFLVPYVLDFQWMTLKNYWAPFLCHFKRCVTFRSQLLNKTRVAVLKHPNLVKKYPCDPDVWPLISSFYMKSLWFFEITPGNVMLTRREEHYQKVCVSDGEHTDGETDRTVYRAAWSQLKQLKSGDIWVL